MGQTDSWIGVCMKEGEGINTHTYITYTYRQQCSDTQREKRMRIG